MLTEREYRLLKKIQKRDIFRVEDLTKAGKPVTAPDDVFERPLRAMTMQGPRVSVSASEIIEAGWELTFTITLLENPASPKSKALTFDVIEEALNYGAFKGLGQWRNGQNGRFIWERAE